MRTVFQDTAKIEELEKCRDSNIVHIPSWRSLNTSVSVSSVGSRADEMQNTGDAGQTSHAVSENGSDML